MRNAYLILLILTATLLINRGSFANELYQSSSQNIQWQHYSALAFSQASSNKHYILLYAESASCHWCQEMSKTTWQTAALINLVQNNFVPVMVDVDTEMNIAARYRVSSLPTVIILDSDNRIIKIFSGYFPPDFMQKSLQAILQQTSTPGNTPEIVQAPPAGAENSDIIHLAPEKYHELKTSQLQIYSHFPIDIKYFDVSEVEYALLVSAENEKVVKQWITSLIDSYSTFNDPVWGGIYSFSANRTHYFEKRASFQAEALHILSQVNAYWPDPRNILLANKIINYINNFLTSPDGVFYTSQVDYLSNGTIDENFYRLDDVHRRQLGIPKVNTEIYTDDNARLIASFVDYYKMTGDISSLNKALKAARWIIDNLSIPYGGFRHAKNENDIIYLSDTLGMSHALLELYQATNTIEFLNRASDAMGFINKYFAMPDGKPGFLSSVDLRENAITNSDINATENTELIRVATLLYSYTGDKVSRDIALNSFHFLITPGTIENTLPAQVLTSEYRITNDPTQIVVVGTNKDPLAYDLYKTVLREAPVYTRTIWWDRNEGPLMNSTVSYPILPQSAAYVCYGHHCSFPIYKPQDLFSVIHNIPTSVPETSPLPASSNNELVPLTKIDDLNVSSFNIDNFLNKHNWLWLIVGFIIFGLLLSFTPCMLPLIPIMASIIVGQTIGVRKERTFLLCLAYVLAMALTYSCIGICAAKFGLYLQIYAQERWIVILYSFIFFILGLSMLDAYELQLPKAVLQKVNAWSNFQKGGTFPGVIIMGALSTLIVSPCVSAALAGVLTFVTKTGNLLLGGIGLFFMGLGIGIPLLIITLFSKNILPRVSQWNDKIKLVFGMISIGLAIWIVSRAISEIIVMTLWSAFIIFISIYMGVLNSNTNSLFEKALKTLTIMVFVFGIALFLEALFTESNFYNKLPIDNRVAIKTTAKNIKTVKNNFELIQALNEAKAKHLPVLLNFTAKWCRACMHMERDVFDDPSITNLLKQFILIRVDLTSVDSGEMALAQQFHISGIPISLFFGVNGKLLNLRAEGDFNSKEFNVMLIKAFALSKIN